MASEFSALPLPNLVMAGFPKCGTTSVASTLSGHPDVCTAFPRRATHYFTPLLYDPSAELAPIQKYADHFSSHRDESIKIDDTVIWAYGGQRVAAALRRALGRPRILMMLREPVSRTSSYLIWKKRHGEADQDLQLAAYVRECERLGPDAVVSEDLNVYSGLYGSDYLRFLPPWINEFGDDLRIGFLDDLKHDPVGFYRALASWLAIAPDYFTVDRLQIANTAKTVKNARAERTIRRVGRRLQPLASHAPGVYRFMRESARRVNMTDAATTDAADSSTLAHLRDFFAPDRPALAELVRGRELRSSPSWLVSS